MFCVKYTGDKFSLDTLQGRLILHTFTRFMIKPLRGINNKTTNTSDNSNKQ